MRFEWVLGWASKVDTYPVPSPRIALCMRDEDRIPGSRAKIPPPPRGLARRSRYTHPRKISLVLSPSWASCGIWKTPSTLRLRLLISGYVIDRSVGTSNPVSSLLLTPTARANARIDRHRPFGAICEIAVFGIVII